MVTASPCTPGRVELDQSRYCSTHGGFQHWQDVSPLCDKAPRYPIAVPFLDRTRQLERPVEDVRTL